MFCEPQDWLNSAKFPISFVDEPRTLIPHVVMPARARPDVTFSPFRHLNTDVVIPKSISRKGNTALRQSLEEL